MRVGTRHMLLRYVICRMKVARVHAGTARQRTIGELTTVRTYLTFLLFWLFWQHVGRCNQAAASSFCACAFCAGAVICGPPVHVQ
jgi:hypothetical protein